jgi:hypothetical protein
MTVSQVAIGAIKTVAIRNSFSPAFWVRIEDLGFGRRRRQLAAGDG